MPKSTRKTRSATRSGKSQRVEIFIKKEDKKITYDNSSQQKLAAMSTLDSSDISHQQVQVLIKREDDAKITYELLSQHKFTAIPTTDSTIKDNDGDSKILLAKVESEKVWENKTFDFKG